MNKNWLTDMESALDKIRPNWVLDWADQTDLRDMARGYNTLEQIRNRVSMRLFYPIINAAIEAGVVK